MGARLACLSPLSGSGGECHRYHSPHDPEHLAPTSSGTELGLTASPPTGGSRAETREATGLETGWRGGVLFFLMLHVHEERRWPRASSSTVSWAV